MAAPHALTLVWPDGREATAPAPANQPVLEAAEAAGLRVPFGCRTGACASCVGRTLAGRVSYVRPPRALKPRHRAAGYVLCCIARPETDLRLAVGADVRAELVTNPWK